MSGEHELSKHCWCNPRVEYIPDAAYDGWTVEERVTEAMEEVGSEVEGETADADLLLRCLRTTGLTVVIGDPFDPKRLTDALMAIGLVQHGPGRIDRPGAPVASAAPSSWGNALRHAILDLAAIRSAAPVEPES